MNEYLTSGQTAGADACISGINFRRLALVVIAAVGLCGNAMAQTTIYDSSSQYAEGTFIGASTNNGYAMHATEAYWANQWGEIGGKIGFAGTDRAVTSATVQLRTGSPVPNPNEAIAGPVTLTLNFYGINGDQSIGSLLGSKTQTFASPAGVNDPATININEGRPYYNATFELASLGLTLPNQVYFGVALQGPGSTATTQSTNLSLWNYGTYGPAWASGTATFDGATVKVGTDCQHKVEMSPFPQD